MVSPQESQRECSVGLPFGVGSDLKYETDAREVLPFYWGGGTWYSGVAAIARVGM